MGVQLRYMPDGSCLSPRFMGSPLPNAGTPAVQCRPRALRRPRLAAANRTTERDFGDLAASWGDPRHTVVLFLELLGDGVLIIWRTHASRLTIHVRSSDLSDESPHSRLLIGLGCRMMRPCNHLHAPRPRTAVHAAPHPSADADHCGPLGRMSVWGSMAPC
jgi:hypothetical protein